MLVVAGLACSASPGAGVGVGPGASRRPLADEAPGARAYLNELNDHLGRIGEQLEQISAAADRAAEAIVAGRAFAVRGSRAMRSELSNRAGAMFGYRGYRGNRGQRGNGGDVILYVLGEDTSLEVAIADAAALRAQGSLVIGLGSVNRLGLLGKLQDVEQATDMLLDNGAPATAGSIIPVAGVLNAALAWTFECELFAACTRQGQTPVVRKSLELDTRHRRLLRYGSQRFCHDQRLDPIAPGVLGRRYLYELDRVLLDVGTASWLPIARTAWRAADSLADGGRVVVCAGGRYVPFHVGGKLAGDPQLFGAWGVDGTGEAGEFGGEKLGYDDLVIAVGTHEPAGSDWWGQPEVLRDAGRGVAWVVNAYNTQRNDLRRGEIVIDQMGPVGDCVVKVEHYDARLGPVGSVVAEAITWMITAEVWRLQQEFPISPS